MWNFKWLAPVVVLGMAAIACTGASDAGGNPDADGATPPAAQSPAPDSSAASPEVTPDPDYDDKLRRAGLSTSVWETDFSLHSVPYSEISSGGVPRDGIPPIDNPQFVSIEDADQWLAPREPVISFEMNGETRAYPLQIMTWHEIVNDEVGGVPVAATFCPLCNSAIVFDRRLEGQVYDFGVSGNLRNSDLIMWDRQTESWWQQLTGEAIVGELTGKRLDFLPAPIISWEDFKESRPGGEVLSRDTGHQRRYGDNPYVGYDQADRPPFLFNGEPDGRLQPKERVAAFTIEDAAAAFPFSVLENERVVHDTVNGQDVVVFFKPGTRSALDDTSIATSKEVGATGVFDPELGGRELTFRAEGDQFVDNETGSTWTILGEAVEGELAGESLTPIVHGDHFWFSWAAFQPDTLVYQGQD